MNQPSPKITQICVQNDFSLLPVSPRKPYVSSRYESWECAPGSAAEKGLIQCRMLRVTPAGQMLEVNQINTRGTSVQPEGKKDTRVYFINLQFMLHQMSIWIQIELFYLHPCSEQHIRINLSNINEQTRCSSLLPGPAGNMLLSGYQAGASSAN